MRSRGLVRVLWLGILVCLLSSKPVAGDDDGFTVLLQDPTPSQDEVVGRLVRVAGQAYDSKAGRALSAEHVVIWVAEEGTMTSPEARPAIETRAVIGDNGMFATEVDLMTFQGPVVLMFGVPRRTDRVVATRRVVAAGPPPDIEVSVAAAVGGERAEVQGAAATISCRVQDPVGVTTSITINGSEVRPVEVPPAPTDPEQDFQMRRLGLRFPISPPRVKLDPPTLVRWRTHLERKCESRTFVAFVPLKDATWTHVLVEARRPGTPVTVVNRWVRPSGPAPADGAPDWKPEPIPDPISASDFPALPLFARRREVAAGKPPVGGRAPKPSGQGAKWQEPVESALKWLAAHQAIDGRWECEGFGRTCDGKANSGVVPRGAGKAEYDIGVTGLALLALLGAGYTDRSEGSFGRVVGKGLKYLVRVQDSEGCFGPRTHERYIYNHLIASLSMVEAFGMTADPRWQRSSQKALDFISMTRNPYFAWRYGRKPGDNSTAVTAWAVLALATAREINRSVVKLGMSPPLDFDPEALDGARVWLDKMTDGGNGRVGYEMRGVGPTRWEGMSKNFPAEKSEATTAMGVLSRILIGESPKTSGAIKAGAGLCAGLPPVWNTEDGSIDMYYWFWGSQALFQVGGEPWKKWEAAMTTAIASTQRKDTDACSYKGSWDPVDPWSVDGGRVYSTAMMALALEAPRRLAAPFGGALPTKPKGTTPGWPLPGEAQLGEPSWAKVSEAQRVYAKEHGLPVAFANKLGMRFVLIPPGSFTMGSPATEAGRGADETAHTVTLSAPFYLAITEATNGQVRLLDPAHDGDTNLDDDAQPAVRVSHDKADGFLRDLMYSERPPRPYRLPTEAEWEYACRAGTATAYATGEAITPDHARFGGRVAAQRGAGADGTEAPVLVDALSPNAWGLYGMHGNASEWCSDWYGAYAAEAARDPAGVTTGEGRVVRGGGWADESQRLRSAARSFRPPGEAGPQTGFRVAISVTLPPSSAKPTPPPSKPK